MMSRLEEIKKVIPSIQKGMPKEIITWGGWKPVVTIFTEDSEYLLEQAERVEELEKERNDWKGKHSILKRKYKSLQRKMNNRWRANRAIMNESKQKHNVLEVFREENQRYKQALEEIANKSEVDFGNSYANRVYNHSRKLAEQALKGESE